MKINTEWVLWAKTAQHQKRVEWAKDAIKKAMDNGKFVVSWSTGKDSTAMCHLVRSLYPDTPIMIQFDDCDWPEKRPYYERVCKAHGWECHEVRPDFSVFEAAAKGQIGFESFCAQSHVLTRDSFLLPLETKRKELECVGSFIGLRAEESKARRLNLGVRGEVYQLKDGTWHCCPIGRWKSVDVFAYMVAHDMEINPCYFQNMLRDPSNIRLSWALPTPTGIRHGDMEHIRRYYPQQYQRLRQLGVER